MPFLASYNGNKIVAPDLSDDQWDEVKTKKLIFPKTGKRAIPKELHHEYGVTRFFSHLPGEGGDYCPSDNESIEHHRAKLDVYKKLKSKGYEPQLETGMDDWISDVLVNTGKHKVSFEIQCTKQSASETLRRTKQRAKSGFKTCWLHQNAVTGNIGEEFRATPIFDFKKPEDASEIACTFMKEECEFLNSRLLMKTPVKPIAVRIRCKCGLAWLHPLGVFALLSEIDKSLSDEYLSSTFKKSKTTTVKGALRGFDCIDKIFELVSEKYGVPLGKSECSFTHYHNSRKLFVRRFSCPKCEAITKEPVIFIENSNLIDNSPVDAHIADVTGLCSIDPKWVVRQKQTKVLASHSANKWSQAFLEPNRERIQNQLVGKSN